MDYSGIGAALQSFGGFMTDRALQKEEEKKAKEREEAAKKAREEAERKRVERRQLYLKQPDYSQGPPKLAQPAWYEMGTNAAGEVVQDIPANDAQLYDLQQKELAAKAAADKESQKNERQKKLDDYTFRSKDASIRRSEAAARLSEAKLANPEKYGSKGKGKSPEDDVTELQREVAGMLSNPDIQAALKASDPGLLAEIGQQQGFVDKAIGGVKSALGVENNDGSIWSELSKSQNDPELQAQIWKDLLRRIQQSTIKARGRGAGIATPRNQE